jgi:AcrR family transcriptional regulator
MFIPARILRATARSLDPNPRNLTTREREREVRVLSIGRGLLAIYGRNALKFGDVAAGLEISPTTLRRHFTDLDALLGEILRLHLRALSIAIGRVNAEEPDRFRKRRAAYLAYTRTPMGGLTHAHLLLARDLKLLPDDERVGIEETLEGIAECLLPPQDAIHAPTVLGLLDNPGLGAPAIDAALAAQTLVPARPPTKQPAATAASWYAALPGHEADELKRAVSLVAASRGPPAAA